MSWLATVRRPAWTTTLWAKTLSMACKAFQGLAVIPLGVGFVCAEGAELVGNELLKGKLVNGALELALRDGRGLSCLDRLCDEPLAGSTMAAAGRVARVKLAGHPPKVEERPAEQAQGRNLAARGVQGEAAPSAIPEGKNEGEIVARHQVVLIISLL